MKAARLATALALLLAAGSACAQGTPGAGLATLVLRLGDADPRSREQAAAQLGQLGAQAHEAVAPPVAALGDEDAYLRGASAAIALGRLGAAARQALPALVGRLSDPSALVRQLAADTLGGLAWPGWMAWPPPRRQA